VLEEGEVSAQTRFSCEMQCNFKNISILKELILPLNSIQKELIFKKSLERITDIPFGKTRTYLEQSKFLGDPKPFVL
jgi:O6-methylguanine-DNA--protein-cysteine methyltransferase